MAEIKHEMQETAEVIPQDEKLEKYDKLVDDSGEKSYSSELPDDSGEKHIDIPSDSQKNDVSSDQLTTESAGVDDGERNAGLTVEEKAQIKEATGWSDEIIDAIGSMEEYEIYRDANLVEAEIGDKKCLIRNDIDLEKTDQFGQTNRERMANGLPPLDANSRPIQLHHIGQRADSPLAELTFEEHRCGGNDTILHDKKKETEVHGEGNTWTKERTEHWKERSETGGLNDEQKHSQSN